MSDHPETFNFEPELRKRVDEITDKYRMAMAFQMAEELEAVGVPLEMCFHVVIGELRLAASRLVVMACEIEKREPRRDLWIRRAEEDLDEAVGWLKEMQAADKAEECR